MVSFTAENHSDEEVPILETLRHAIGQKSFDAEVMGRVFKSVDRTVKMFYLSQKMQGNLKEFKEDYFVS